MPKKKSKTPSVNKIRKNALYIAFVFVAVVIVVLIALKNTGWSFDFNSANHSDKKDGTPATSVGI